MEKVKVRKYFLDVEEYEENNDSQVFRIYSDVSPILIYEGYNEWGGVTAEKWFLAQDGDLFVVTTEESSVYNYATFEIVKLKTEEIGNISSVGEWQV